jgi:beta-glucosidase
MVEARGPIAATDLGGWDVTRDRHCVETARHSVMVGRSCTDLRLAATVDVAGERIPPRSLDHVAATSFDEYCAITLTTASRDRGDAVVSLEPQAWLAFHDVQLDGRASCRLSAANRGAEPATIELRLDDPLRGELLTTVRVAPTDELTTIAAELAPATGVRTLYAVCSAASVVLESLTV